MTKIESLINQIIICSSNERQEETKQDTQYAADNLAAIRIKARQLQNEVKKSLSNIEIK